MKRKAIFMTLLLLATVMHVSRVEAQDLKGLPQAAQEFITTYFPKLKVAKVEIDSELFESKTYEVELNNAYELAFSSKGEWFEVDCKGEQVPLSLIPQAIQKYIQTNFPGDYITQIERDRAGYEVELQSDLTLIFDKESKFKKIGD